MGLWLAALSGLIAGGALLAGSAVAWFVQIPKRVVAAIMALGAGVLISTLAYELVEEAADDGGLAPDGRSASSAVRSSTSSRTGSSRALGNRRPASGRARPNIVARRAARRQRRRHRDRRADRRHPRVDRHGPLGAAGRPQHPDRRGHRDQQHPRGSRRPPRSSSRAASPAGGSPASGSASRRDRHRVGAGVRRVPVRLRRTSSRSSPRSPPAACSRWSATR